MYVAITLLPSCPFYAQKYTYAQGLVCTDGSKFFLVKQKIVYNVITKKNITSY